VDKLIDPTGTEIVGGQVRLINPEEENLEHLRYLNSGRWMGSIADTSKLAFDSILEARENPEDFLKQGRRFNPTWLNMPANCLSMGPHCHPGGEFAYVVTGQYFDADMSGNRIRTYGEGSIVFYTKGSTHRPLSEVGAEIFYIPFDGIVFGKDPNELARKMQKVGTSVEALEYALHWMVPDKAERQRLMDELAVR